MFINLEILFKILITFSEKNIYAWDDPGIGCYLTYMAVTGIVFFAILFLIEFRVFSMIFYHISNAFATKTFTLNVDDIDEDVLEEKNKVDEMTPDDLRANNLVLDKLTKFYGKLLAVNQVSVAVQR